MFLKGLKLDGRILIGLNFYFYFFCQMNAQDFSYFAFTQISKFCQRGEGFKTGVRKSACGERSQPCAALRQSTGLPMALQARPDLVLPKVPGSRSQRKWLQRVEEKRSQVWPIQPALGVKPAKLTENERTDAVLLETSLGSLTPILISISALCRRSLINKY